MWRLVCLVMWSCGTLTAAGRAAAMEIEVEEAWVARYDGPGWGSSYARAIAVDREGNTLVTGQTETSNGASITTLKYDGEGNQLWEARLDQGQASWAAAVGTDPEGAVYVAGAVADNNRPQNLIVLKYGPGGEELWSRRHASDTRSFSEAAALAVDESGNVYVAATLGGATADYLVVTYDPAGNERWSARHDAGGSDEAPASLTVDAEGNVYVTGTSTRGENQGFLTLKYDLDGHEVWCARYDGLGLDEVVGSPRAIAVDTRGCVYVTGQSGFGAIAWWSAAWDYLTVKYDPNGEEVWIARYNGADNLYDDVIDLELDPQGDPIVTGTSYSNASWSIVTIQYDTEGNERWIASHGGAAQGGGASASALSVDAAGCAAVSGWADGPQSSDAVSLKYDTDGNEVWIARYGREATSEYTAAAALDADGSLHVTGVASDNSGTGYLTLEYDAEGNEVWIRRHQSSRGGIDGAVALATDAAGNVIAAGTTASQGRPGGDYVTVKYDPEGGLLWSARYDHLERDFADSARGLAVGAAGTIHVTGTTQPTDGGHADILTVKYDPDGRLLWARVLAEPYADEAAAIALEATGGAVVAGSSRSGVGSGTEDFLTVRYDAEGEPLWIARYDGPQARSDVPTAIAAAPDGSVFVTGSSRSGALSSSEDCLTLKYDADGGLLWEAFFAGAAGRRDRATAIALYEDGSAFVIGSSETLEATELLTVKYDAHGREVWVARYDTGDRRSAGAVALAVAPDGGVYVTGTIGGGGSARDIATLRYGADGGELWSAVYSGAAGNADWARDLALDPRGGVIVTGASRSGTTAASADCLTVKYDANGRQRWLRRFDGAGGQDEAVAVVFGGPGRIYVAGTAQRADAADPDVTVIHYSETTRAPAFVRGDCDGDGKVGGALADAVFLLRYGFAGGSTPPCLAACDANGDGAIAGGAADGLYLLAFAFLRGPAPPPPFPGCAPGDPDGDATLGCERSPEACR